MKDNILITGLPGTGKTTLLKRLAVHFSYLQPVGFYSEEIREKGIRRGFRLVSLDGQEGILSHVDFPGPHRVGRYGVDINGFEAFLARLDLLSGLSPLVFVDEIGKMECLSGRFALLVKELLDSDKTLVATVASKGTGLIAEVKSRPDCILAEISVKTREVLLNEITEWIRKRL